jgi:uncharacterized protein (TIGR02246 family)
MALDQSVPPEDVIRVQNLLHGFFRAWDARDVEAVAPLMAPDGRWLRGGKAKIGPEGVRAAMAERKQGTTTAHIVDNVYVEARDGQLFAACYVTTFNEPSPDDGSVPTMPLARSIVAYHLLLAKRGGGLVIHEIGNTPVFRRQG